MSGWMRWQRTGARQQPAGHAEAGAGNLGPDVPHFLVWAGPLPAGKGPGGESVKGHVGLVTSATKVLMGLGQVQELLLLPWGAVGRI